MMLFRIADLKNDKLTNTGLFKMLVSGDPMKAEKKHCQPFDFENYAKLFFSANEIPQSEGSMPTFGVGYYFSSKVFLKMMIMTPT